MMAAASVSFSTSQLQHLISLIERVSRPAGGRTAVGGAVCCNIAGLWEVFVDRRCGQCCEGFINDECDVLLVVFLVGE